MTLAPVIGRPLPGQNVTMPSHYPQYDVPKKKPIGFPVPPKTR